MDRHDREAMTKEAKGFGMSREQWRKLRLVGRCDESDQLFSQAVNGEISVDAAYRQAVTPYDDRVPLYLKLDKDIDDRVRAAAGHLGVSRQQIVIALIEEWLSETVDDDE